MRTRSPAGALIGTALEWYDFFLFSAAAALIFNVQYFTNENATAAALASFATFGVGLAARPIGGLVFGRMGDKLGRRRVLLITIIGIGVVTGLIGLLPTYAAIGFAAPALLVLLRILQGLFVGGEWSGAMTLVVENAPAAPARPLRGDPADRFPDRHHPVLRRLLHHDARSSRRTTSIPSAGGSPSSSPCPLLILAIYLRSRLEESPVFRQLEEAGEVEKSPISTTLCVTAGSRSSSVWPQLCSASAASTSSPRSASGTASISSAMTIRSCCWAAWSRPSSRSSSSSGAEHAGGEVRCQQGRSSGAESLRRWSRSQPSCCS
jgi:hypothetical protein